MKPDHWKNYPPIEGVTVSDMTYAWPVEREIHVLAQVGGAEVGRPARIVVEGVCALDLTRAQLADLRIALALAEDELRAPAPPAAPAVTAIGAEGRCESCSRPVRAGELICIEDEGTEDRVVLHAGPCPGTDRKSETVTATGAEGECGSCGQPIRAGETVHVVAPFLGDPDGVAVHAGPCLGVRSANPDIVPERSN